MVGIITSSVTRVQRELELRMSEGNTYKIIEKPEDVRGRPFDAVIFMHGWYESEDAQRAVDVLKIRQPELFNFKSK